MKDNTMDKSGSAIIKICIFSIIISLTALLFCGLFQYLDRLSSEAWEDTPLPTIVIDAGHGGEDGGALASDGTKEKDLNLSVALSLSEMLKSGGYEVILTRDSDVMLYSDEGLGSKKMQDLKKRLDIATSLDNVVFVSIHMNKFSQEKYRGTQVFYSKNDETSKQLADMIQSNIKEFLQKDNDRQTKSVGTNIYLLNKLDCPAVLVECGFLSNKDECDLLKNEEYRKQLAALIYCSVIEFLSA